MSPPSALTSNALSPADAVTLLERQTAVMQLIADGASLSRVLDAVVLALEDLMPGTRSSILLKDPREPRLRHGAAPSLPVAYSRAIDGLELCRTAGSCGTAAFTGEEVIAEDVLTDPRWDDYRVFAVPYGLRACWSSPIRGSDGILGTFAVYHDEPHRPNARERGLVERFTHLASVAIDHHRLYGALADSEERFRRAFDDNAVGMALTGLDGIVIRANPALLELLGAGECDVIGADLAALVTVVEPATSRPSGAVSYEAVVRHPGGRRARLAVTASTICDSAGRPARLCLNVVDVTQRWEAAQERQARQAAEYARRSAEEARRNAEAASTAKSAFVSALSHELRTPLQAITGFTELLSGLDLTPERRQAALTHIGEASQHILALVDDVLDLARVEAGALPLTVVDVDAADVVHEVLDLLLPLAWARQVHLDRAAASVMIRADRRRLRQVLLNVVGNGIRYNHMGGRVSVGVEPVAADSAEIVVRDTGPGISADLMQRLFVPFDRLDADAGPERGVGLGLVLSRSLAEAMSGGLAVSSEVGEGTTVRITLPRENGRDGSG